MSDRSDAMRHAQETMRRLQHEVRTPISQIIGYSELIEEELSDRGADDLGPDLRRIRDAAQRLLDLVDGRLQDEADPGAPPLPEPVEHDEGPSEAPAHAPDEKLLRVLVVDGDANDRELIARRLGHGFLVDQASDGVEGLRLIESGDYDLVLLEVLLQGMNGLEVLERARRTRTRSELPILLTTALGGSEDVVEGLERGANDYVVKPLDFPVLRARIRSEIEAHRLARSLAGLARQLEFRSSFIREALGREISDDLLVELAERPGELDLSSERRPVLAVSVGLRGAREPISALEPTRRAALAKNALDALVAVIVRQEGLLDVVSGEGLVALFGLPVAREDDAVRAVSCALALQLEVEELNVRNRQLDLPELEIAVGVAQGDAVVVGFRVDEEARFKAIGDPLLWANRIEGSAESGEVWICEATRAAVEASVRVDLQRRLALPSIEEPVLLHRVLGLGGSRPISLRSAPGD